MIHPLALVHETARLGEGTAVWAFAHVRGGVVTGRHVSIGGTAEIHPFLAASFKAKIRHESRDLIVAMARSSSLSSSTHCSIRL